MRKVYILRASEEDGTVLDAMKAQGISTDVDELENPKCPHCGADTLLAYSEDEEFEVLTWFCLTDENEGAEADSWFLICSSFDCAYEEQVERVRTPMGATLFDLDYSHREFDEYCGISSRRPDQMKELIQYLEELIEERPNRKLQCYLDEANWRYEYDLEQIRKWIRRVPAGRTVSFTHDGKNIKGKFLAGTDDGLLIQTREGELLAINAEVLRFYGPKRFDQPDPEEQDDEIRLKRWITIHSGGQWLVVGGHHLRLMFVDRFGQHHARCSDEEVAHALGMTQISENYWEGHFLRTEIEMRYDVISMIKVRGHWVEVWGTSGQGEPAVHTEDPEVAALLDLKPQSNWLDPEDYDIPQVEITRWSGVVPKGLVEDRKEIRQFLWPIPEFQGSE